MARRLFLISDRCVACFTGGIDWAGPGHFVNPVVSVLPGLGWACHSQPTIIALSSSLRL